MTRLITYKSFKLWLKWSIFQNSGAAAKGGKREKAKEKKADEPKGAKDKIDEQV